MKQFITGTVTGTGSAINVQLGWKPDWVRAINYGDTAPTIMEWTSAMTDGHGIKTVTAGTTTKLSSNGITPYEGTEGGDSPGFTIGADADLNASGEAIVYIAGRNN
jgi:hypothetical protein